MTTASGPDVLARLIRDLSRLRGSAAVGAVDEETARKLNFSEFGTPTAEPRPTISVATDAHRAAIFRAIERQVGAVMDGRGRGTTGQEIVADVGRDLAEVVREKVDSNVPPDLADSTKARRLRLGRDTRTLVDSGDMMRSIGVETSADPEAFDAE